LPIKEPLGSIPSTAQKKKKEKERKRKGKEGQVREGKKKYLGCGNGGREQSRALLSWSC
jgi:hypothetical protein